MKIYRKYNVDLSDGGYNFAQYDFGTLREVLAGGAGIWYNREDDVYYTIDRDVAAFYDDLDDALENLDTLDDMLQEVVTGLYEEDPPVASSWTWNYFYNILDDAPEVVYHFARWEDARAAFVDMIERTTDDARLLEEFKCRTM